MEITYLSEKERIESNFFDVFMQSSDIFNEDLAKLWLRQYNEMVQTLQSVYSEFEKEEDYA